MPLELYNEDSDLYERPFTDKDMPHPNALPPFGSALPRKQRACAADEKTSESTDSFFDHDRFKGEHFSPPARATMVDVSVSGIRLSRQNLKHYSDRVLRDWRRQN